MDDAQKADLEARIQGMSDCIEAIKGIVTSFQSHALILEHGRDLENLIQRQNDLLQEMNKSREQATSLL